MYSCWIFNVTAGNKGDYEQNAMGNCKWRLRRPCLQSNDFTSAIVTTTYLKEDIVTKTYIKGEKHPKPEFRIFGRYLWILSTCFLFCFCFCFLFCFVFEMILCIMEQIIWQTQLWHYNFGRLCSSWVIDQNNILNVLINNSRSAWPTKIAMPFLSFSDNLLQDAYIIFQNNVDNFETAHKTCQI